MNDDWNPSLEDETVVRPHLQDWKPCAKARDAPKPDELHDPDADRDDEKWVAENLMSDNSSSLSCAGCFTPVCYNSQKHDRYEQYRALEAYQCTVDKTTILTQDDNTFHPVRCKVCNAEVAVFDKDDVYHFFNVIPSSSVLT
eukprot:GEMP01044769.1.p1 GENE.GEMP01044769.1~~GEMP01044769.1.p1  ORF type:complete len:142 (+),score=19.88 GEMP01044769.1:1310-1735(+)